VPQQPQVGDEGGQRTDGQQVEEGADRAGRELPGAERAGLAGGQADQGQRAAAQDISENYGVSERRAARRISAIIASYAE